MEKAKMWNYFPVQCRPRQCLIGHVFYMKSAAPSVQWLAAINESWGNCIKIGLQGKLILSKKKGLLEVMFS